jgi:hypothetical protein
LRFDACHSKLNLEEAHKAATCVLLSELHMHAETLILCRQDVFTRRVPEA